MTTLSVQWGRSVSQGGRLANKVTFSVVRGRTQRLVVRAERSNPKPARNASVAVDPAPTPQQLLEKVKEYKSPATYALGAVAVATVLYRRVFNPTAKGPKKHEDPADVFFDLFDKDGNGHIDFSEVVYGLKQLTPTGSLESARQSALDVMLLYDKDDNRVLNREEFKSFLRRFQDLTHTRFSNPREMAALLQTPANLTDDEERFVEEMNKASRKEVDAMLRERKLDGIFDLWDDNNDGYVRMRDLCRGLQLYDYPTETSQDARRAATDMVRPGLNGSGDTFLDRDEFGDFVSRFAETAKQPFFEVADFLLIIPMEMDIGMETSDDERNLVFESVDA